MLSEGFSAMGISTLLEGNLSLAGTAMLGVLADAGHTLGGKAMSKKKKSGSKITPIIIGAILVIGSLMPVSASLFGQTGYITEITSSKRFGGELGDGALPNTYEWHIGYRFKTKSGEYETGSVTVKGDAISSKSGLRVGSPVHYLAFAPQFNTPGEGMFDGSTIMYVLLIGVGVFMITLGIRKEKPSKTPAQRSREYRAAKAVMPETGQQAPQTEPDWDSFEYDDKTPITEAEADELYRLATEEEVEDEFDLINSVDEGAAYCRKVLAIVRWRRANWQ